MKDFFISYNSADRAWAEWIAWQLEEANYTVAIQEWDSLPGKNFVQWMDESAKESERTIAVLSPAYVDAKFTKAEWIAAYVEDPTGERGKLLPIRIKEFDIKGLLRPIVYVDLVGLDEKHAKDALIKSVKLERAKPDTPPSFPGSAQRVIFKEPRFPGALPPMWNVPYLRNPNFTGREALLTNLRKALTSEQSTILTQAIHGLGGVGKTQLALEYTYRYMNAYDVVWWISSENLSTLDTNYANLAVRLNFPEKDETEQSVMVAAVRDWLNQNPGWLLIFDNAQDMEEVRPYLPQAAIGHVLITSRNVNWEGMASSFKVTPFDPQESVAYLLKRTGQEDQNAAKQLAEELGHLPLALAQAGAYIKSAQKSLAAYLNLFRQHQQVILARGKPETDYENTVATTWELSFEQAKSARPKL
jgi:hypothetical protein